MPQFCNQCNKSDINLTANTDGRTLKQIENSWSLLVWNNGHWVYCKRLQKNLCDLFEQWHVNDCHSSTKVIVLMCFWVNSAHSSTQILWKVRSFNVCEFKLTVIETDQLFAKFKVKKVADICSIATEEFKVTGIYKYRSWRIRYCFFTPNHQLLKSI